MCAPHIIDCDMSFPHVMHRGMYTPHRIHRGTCLHHRTCCAMYIPHRLHVLVFVIITWFFHAEQIQVYFPGEAHPAAGVVRTFVHDNLDVDSGEASQVCLPRPVLVATVPCMQEHVVRHTLAHSAAL